MASVSFANRSALHPNVQSEQGIYTQVKGDFQVDDLLENQ
jgi:hypothetical protein